MPPTTPRLLQAILIFLAMALAFGLSVAARPTAKLADNRPSISLETLVPNSFGNWRIDESIHPVLPAPDVQAKLDKLYSQTLARTYIDKEGHRLMLSVAYGGDQSDALQVHRPEVCYASQGFQIHGDRSERMSLAFGGLPIRRVQAVQGPRVEYITYWVTVGDSATAVGLPQKLAQMAYSITGKVPDGMLVRVSSIDADEQRAYRLQDAFVADLLQTIPADARIRLAGRFDGK